MDKNKIKIIIERPIAEVFEFTVNPKNTSLWISHIKQELSDNYPPNVGTIYKNTGDFEKWDFYIVEEFEKNKVFTLRDKDSNYHVRYTYKKLGDNKTEMTYFEWVEKGELKSPFTLKVLERLKEVV